jgi:hypothetical protein
MAEGRPIPDASIAIASYAPSISSLSGDSFIVWTTDENGYFEGTIVFNSWVYYSMVFPHLAVIV